MTLSNHPQRATRAVLVLALLAAGAAGAAKPPAPGVDRFRPHPGRMVAPYQVSGRAVQLTSMGVTVRVEQLDEARRQSYFEQRTRLGRDPFPPRDVYPKGVTVFEASILNGSASRLHYAPSLSTCFLDRDKQLQPVHPDQLFAILRGALAAADDPDRAATTSLGAFHVDPTSLDPGERLTRLLVFEGAPAGTTHLTLFMDQVNVGTEPLLLRFEFVAADLAADRTQRPPRLNVPAGDPLTPTTPGTDLSGDY